MYFFAFKVRSALDGLLNVFSRLFVRHISQLQSLNFLWHSSQNSKGNANGDKKSGSYT